MQLMELPVPPPRGWGTQSPPSHSLKQPLAGEPRTSPEGFRERLRQQRNFSKVGWTPNSPAPDDDLLEL